jgi:hypothetical protein
VTNFTKDDIEYHSEGFHRSSRPAVNVKIYKSLDQGYEEWKVDNPDCDPRFTMEWVEQFCENNNDFWNAACEDGWEELQEIAVEIWGKNAKVYAEGRSNGWAVIHGIDIDVDSWDAIELGKWAKFAKWARDIADHRMYVAVDFIYINAFEAWKDHQATEIENELDLGFI